jgi:hypothetical protein
MDEIFNVIECRTLKITLYTSAVRYFSHTVELTGMQRRYIPITEVNILACQGGKTRGGGRLKLSNRVRCQLCTR